MDPATAWVLVVLFVKSGFTVPGIATKEECEALGKQIVAQMEYTAHPQCFAYKGIVTFKNGG